MPASARTTQPAAWPEGVIARYLTVGGAHVDLSYVSRTGMLVATCAGCEQIDRTSTGSFLSDTPEKEQERIEETLPEIREVAQGHAEKCRAMPRPTA